MGFKTYTGKKIDVQFDSERCVHAAECVNGLPEVFDVKKRPWISPDNENAARIADVVERCPSGALQYVRKDNGDKEAPNIPTTVHVEPKGKMYVRGDLQITNEAESIHATRVILCGCGKTGNYPFCDNNEACR
ncbi:hypothetical protein DX933_05805 [Ornithinibacillus gellani]|uniref:(4Fe-4S)-binding protein n=1 Tax=Ornithinibacillus gellani TaxID=2293253 RepID=UPI000F484B0B|nr:(4Fe-4S)-binding protein [Ornithinibacillus gellani]TQS75784.1 hypothetical protein DX933_05805 [Ornithinibacillus gellani]